MSTNSTTNLKENPRGYGLGAGPWGSLIDRHTVCFWGICQPSIKLLALFSANQLQISNTSAEPADGEFQDALLSVTSPWRRRSARFALLSAPILSLSNKLASCALISYEVARRDELPIN